MIPIPGVDTGGGSVDLGTSATSGDVYSTTTANQGGLTINKGLVVPPWAAGVSIIGVTVLGGVYLWKKK